MWSEVIRAALSFGLNRNAIIIAPWSTGSDQFVCTGQLNGVGHVGSVGSVGSADA